MLIMHILTKSSMGYTGMQSAVLQVKNR